MTISVCIATYRRPERLALLLDDLRRQDLPPDEVVVVDNDIDAAARPIVERARGACPFPIRYDIQTERNIALTRNRTVALAGGEWLAFIDDDERAPAGWLRQLSAAALSFNVDAVIAPVLPQVPSNAPHWIRRGDFYSFARMQSGVDVPRNKMRFGNVLLRGAPLRALPGPFDPAYGLTTGEDADLLLRLVDAGSRVVWCDEAIVWEPIEPARLSLRWLLQRALSGGQEFARKSLAGRYGRVTAVGRATLFSRAFAQLCASLVLTLAAVPLGRHRAASWLVRAWANLGKLSVFWGWTYSEYSRI